MQYRIRLKGDRTGHVVRLQRPQAALENSDFVSAIPKFLTNFRIAANLTNLLSHASSFCFNF